MAAPKGTIEMPFHHSKNSFPMISSEILAQVKATSHDPDRSEVIQDHFLQSLSFPQMGDRENEVNKATSDTYSWLLKDESDFVTWLINADEEIYWINGKPGCGKSTLMRFVSENPITARKLKIWSGNKPFASAAHYFWTSGTRDQRSQAGLLRSLLSQLLTTHRELIPLAIPDLWMKVWKMSTQDRIKTPIVWELGTLLDALKMFFGQLLVTKKVILFIDGLDEFDGDHAEIISVFNNLVKDAHKSIKLCLSSRSWPVFEEGYRGRPQFKLQDFTYQDITLHVSHNLKSEKSLATISQEMPEWYSKLVELIVQKAEGVFLWANLAVQYICKASHWLDEAEDKKLNSTQVSLHVKSIAENLPGELDDLFNWLVFDHPRSNPATLGLPAMLLKARDIATDFTGDHTMAIISLWDLVAATESPSEHGKDSAPQHKRSTWIDDTESEVMQLSNPELMSGLTYYKNAIGEAAPGLLVRHIKGAEDEPVGPQMIGDDDYEGLTREQREASAKVTYAHRTVKDWLDREDIEQKLAKAVFKNAQPSQKEDYCLDWFPHMINLGICQISRRRPILPPRKGRSINDIWPFVVLTMTHARLAEDELETLLGSHLSDLLPIFQERYTRRVSAINSVLTWYWRKSPGKAADDTWAKNSFGSYEERHSMLFNDPWLSICTRFGLRIYVSEYLRALSGRWKTKGEIPLLSHAVDFLVNRKSTVYPLSDPELVKMLLERGFSPNEEYTQFKRRLTPWLYLLENLQQAERRGWIAAEGAQRWVRICNLFLSHGALLKARTPGWAKDPSVEAGQLLGALKKKYGLVALMEEKPVLHGIVK